MATHGPSVEPENQGSIAEPESEVAEPNPESENAEPTPEFEGWTKSEPNVYEVAVPPFLFVLLLFSLLLTISILTQKSWWRQKFTKRSFKREERIRTYACVNCPLLEDNDKVMMSRLEVYQNNLWSLIQIATPALLSMAFCPIAIFMYMPMMKLFWPPDEYEVLPHINDTIQGFLTPAGLVYAISFGFAFQEAVSSQVFVSTKLTILASNIKQILHFLNGVPHIQTKDRLTIIRILKEETMCWIKAVIFYKQKIEHESRLHEILTILRLAEPEQKGKKRTVIQKLYMKHLIKDVLNLDQLRTESLRRLRGKMNTIQWVFMESLAYMSFLGILLLDAGSYRFQLAICVITVAAISMFCYILADIDNPFHGFFKTDLTLFFSLFKVLCVAYEDSEHAHDDFSESNLRQAFKAEHRESVLIGKVLIG